MPAGKRSVTIDGIISGRHDIVIGTRTALLAPLKKLSFMMVLHEHSSSYKIEEGVRFNTRDVAVMRGFIEKIPVMLTSPVPSIDSWFNAQSGKYRPLALEPTVQRPKIKIVDMRFSKKVKPYLSKALVDAAKKYLQKAERIMFVINRRGHSTMLLCAECGSTEKCTACGIPLVLHKDRNLVRCHYCGKSRSVPESCSTCKSPNLSLLGAGTQKIEEDMRELFGMEPLRFDSDRAKRKTAIRQLVDEAALDASKIMVGTKMMTKRIGPSGSFSLAGMLTIDSSLNTPDFRAREKTYREITDLLDLVGPRGEIIIQTRFPQDPLFKCIRDNDYETFAREELTVRKAMNFPPYSRLLNILVSGNAPASEKILKIVHEAAQYIEVLGPMEKKTKKGAIESSLLLKSRDRKALHAAARSVLETFRNAKDIEIRIDVDPQ
jgi:primosomal protein N' (replication factor Y)